METLGVDLGDRSYPIYIGSGLLDRLGDLLPTLAGKQVLVVTNTTIAPLYLDRVMAGLEGLQACSLILPDGEQYKTLDTLNLIFTKLLEQKHSRTTTLVALGGGVIGDLTGFAAAAYQRGVDFVQIPTTLLSQVDSSVGGKTGVNHALGKNMIGAFHQPKAVIADTETLSTLPARELSAGLAEVIKYGLIRDEAFLHWMEDNMSRLVARDGAALTHAIKRSCGVKAEVVAADEREGGGEHDGAAEQRRLVSCLGLAARGHLCYPRCHPRCHPRFRPPRSHVGWTQIEWPAASVAGAACEPSRSASLRASRRVRSCTHCSRRAARAVGGQRRTAKIARA